MIIDNNTEFITIEDGKYTVFSGCPEFGYELIATLPYCYYLFKKNLLKKTVSGVDTRCLYYFSPSHEELSIKRNFNHVKFLAKKSFPNIEIHRNQLDWSCFTPPPLKEVYKFL